MKTAQRYSLLGAVENGGNSSYNINGRTPFKHSRNSRVEERGNRRSNPHISLTQNAFYQPVHVLVNSLYASLVGVRVRGYVVATIGIAEVSIGIEVIGLSGGGDDMVPGF